MTPMLDHLRKRLAKADAFHVDITFVGLIPDKNYEDFETWTGMCLIAADVVGIAVQGPARAESFIPWTAIREVRIKDL